MKKLIISILILLTVVVGLGTYQIAQVYADIAEIEEKIQEGATVYQQNEAELAALKANPIDSSIAWELETARQWLLNPEEDTFDEMYEVLEPFISRDELFKWYIDSNVMDDYMTYISASGVRKYKASKIRQDLLSPDEEWWLKDLYKTPEQSKVGSVLFVPTVDIEIPRWLIASQQEFDNFLTTMEKVFPNKN